MARKFGSSEAYWYSIGHGTGKVTDEVLANISAFFGEPPEWFLEEHREDPIAPAAPPAELARTGSYVPSANDRRARDILDQDPDLKDAFFALTARMQPLSLVDRAVILDSLEAILANIRSAQAA